MSGSNDDNEIGYKKPPSATQFRKGVSGNAGGRPRKPKAVAGAIETASSSVDKLLRAETLRAITVRENDQAIDMPIYQAALRSLGVSAVKGNLKAQLAIAKMAKELEAEEMREQHMYYRAGCEIKEFWRLQIRYFDDCGLSRPDVLPHTEDIVLMHATSTTIVNGPYSQEEKAIWDEARQCVDTMSYLRDIMPGLARAAEEFGIEVEADVEGLLQTADELIEVLNAYYPAEEVRRQPGFNLIEQRKQAPPARALPNCLKNSRASKRRSLTAKTVTQKKSNVA